MSETFIWYSFDELRPHDKDWVLVADDRFETPKKALFKKDACDTLRYEDKCTFDADYPFEHAYAWMPLPPMPSREMVEKGVCRV